MAGAAVTGILWAFLPAGADEPVLAFVVDADGQIMRRGDAAQCASGDFEKCVAVVPGVGAALAFLGLPKGTTVQMEAAAKLMMQDIVAGEDTNAAVAVSSTAQDDGTRLVAHFDTAICEDVMTRLAACGLDPDVIVPAAALLPPPSQGSIRAAYLGVDIARSTTRAFAAEPAVMDYILEGEQPCERLDEAALSTHFVETARRLPSLNLRVGAYSKPDASRFSPRWLKRSAILLGVAALLWPALSLVQAFQYEQAAERLDLQVMERVRAALPDAPRIVNARAQLRERMSALGLRGGPEQLLGHLARAIESQPGTTTQSLVYGPQQGLTATLIIADQNRLDQLIATLKRAGVSAQAQPIRATRDGPRAELTLKAER
ncbi:MAG: type II secretion system protein GspL [Pseudomonadota bacterium]